MPFVQTTRIPEDAWYEEERGLKAVRFIQRACVHTKSRLWSGKRFKMLPWQKGSVEPDETGELLLSGIVKPLFGVVRNDPMVEMNSPDGDGTVRQFETAWIELGRKNGKSELIAALALYLLLHDSEPAAEIYSVAKDKRQASMVFDVARDMIRLSPVLSRMVKRGEIEIVDSQKRIIHVPSRAVYRVVSADAGASLGSNPYAVVVDEVLEQPDGKLWDYLRQGAGTRANFLLIGITTAGPDRDSFAYGEHELSLRAAQNPEVDPSRFVFMAYTDESADYRDERNWFDANPGLFDDKHPKPGYFLNIRTLRKELNEALNSGDLAKLRNFRIFRLNQWGVKADRWLDMEVWDDSEATAGLFTEDDISPLWAAGGLDLANTSDIVSWQLAFADAEHLYVKSHHWITRQAITAKHKKMEKQFLRWAADGWLEIVEDEAYDYDKIAKYIIQDIGDYKVYALGFDPAFSAPITKKIEDQTDCICVKIPQTTSRMNPGSQELVRRLGRRQLSLNCNPLMRWQAENTAYQQDSELCIKPSKKNSTENIDGIVALVNALATYATVPPEEYAGNFYAAEECPRCGDLEIRDSDGVLRCGECGYVWTLEDEGGFE